MAVADLLFKKPTNMVRAFLISIYFLTTTLLAGSATHYPEHKIDSALKRVIHKKEVWKKNSARLASHSLDWPVGNQLPATVIDLSGVLQESLVPLSKPFKADKELILAFSPHHFHTFIIAGDLEFHAPIYPGKTFYRYVVNDAFRSGIFIQFNNVSATDIANVKKYIRFLEGHKTEMCLMGALEVLARGADILAPSTCYYSLKNFMKSVIKNGFKKSGGESVDFRIFKTSDKTVRKIFSAMRHTEISYGIFGLFGILGARTGRLIKNRSEEMLKKEFYYHPEFPTRNTKKKK